MGQYYDIANDNQYISIAKTVPLRPEIFFSSDSVTATTFIKNIFFQFRVRYIYDDGGIGCCSVISDISVPDPVVPVINRIMVIFNSGHKTVVKIQLMRRIGNGVSETAENNTEWYIFQTLDKIEQGYADDTLYSFPFYGNEGIIPVSRIDSDKIFESVPYFADQPEVTDTNQILLGSVTEGNDNVSMDVNVEYNYYFNGCYYYATLFGGAPKFYPYKAGCEPAIGDTMYGSITPLSQPPPLTFFNYILSAPDIVSPLSMANKLSSVLTGLGFANTVVALGGGVFQVSPTLPAFFVVASYRHSFIRSLKSGVRRSVSIVYYDEKGRCTGSQVVAKNIYSKAPIELGTHPVLGGANQSLTTVETVPYLVLTINNLPPTFASYYQVLISESDTGDFIQFMNFSTSNYCVIPDPSAWSYEKGDRVRVLDDATSLPIVINDYAIKSFDTTTGVIVLEGLEGASYTRSIFEIYRPNRTTRQLFYEFSGVREIVGGYHAGNVQNQTDIDPAIVNIFFGDVYEKVTPRIITTGNYFIHQTKNIATDTQFINGTYEDISSPYWGKGRVIVETPNQRRQKFGQLRRWSNRLMQNTFVNGLSVWDEGNYNNDLNARFGDITAIRQIGFVIKTIQWSNIASTLINRVQLMNADGTSNIIITDKLLGTTNPSEEEFGTKHPGSVCVAGSHLYFLDTIKGKVLRDATNGLFPISDFFMKKYWRDKSDLINSDVLYEVISGFDHKFEDYYITVKKPKSGVRLSQNTEETLYFNEGQKLWKYFVDMKTYTGEPQIIDWYGWVGQTLYTFMNGNVWQENALLSGSTPVYLNRFAEQKSLIVETIGMIDDDKVKIFTTHAIHSNIRPTLVELFIPATTMYPNGMYTYLKAGNYSYKEGVFYASIKNDWYTKGVPVNNGAGNLQIAEGRRMRGHVVKVRLTYTTQEYAKLFSTSIGMVPSDKS